MKKVAVLGAGGKMGYRVSANLKGAPYQVSHIEVSEAGRNRLKELGITCVDADAALPEADVVILAIPDNMIEKVTAKLVDKFKQGGWVMYPIIGLSVITVWPQRSESFSPDLSLF